MPTMRNKKLVNESMGAKPKERSKTGIARKLAMGVPLVASASGVKGGRGANRAFGALTGVTAAKSGVKVDPLALVSMALPVGKLIAAAKALKAAGRVAEAGELIARAAAKAKGQRIGSLIAQGETLAGNERSLASALEFRSVSTRAYPRVPRRGPMGQPDLGDLGGGGIGLPYQTPAQIRRAQKVRRMGTEIGTRMPELERRLNFPRQTGVPEAYGQAAAKEIARNAKTPKMTPQQAQNSYERVSDLIKGGRAAKEIRFSKAHADMKELLGWTKKGPKSK
jgi:hypothetical protein